MSNKHSVCAEEMWLNAMNGQEKMEYGQVQAQRVIFRAERGRPSVGRKRLL